MLKLMAEAITATKASSGASSGVGTSPTCSDLRGSLSSEARPANIPDSSRSTYAARKDSGRGALPDQARELRRESPV